MTVQEQSDVYARPFVLPEDVLLFPATELAERVRIELECGERDFVVTRPGFRSLSRVVDADTASLLREFRRPTPIVDAVLRYSRQRAVDPEEMLENAFPVLQSFSAALLLVPEGSPFVGGVVASFGTGQLVGGYEVRRLIQALEDTELYQARAPDGTAVALKVARPQTTPETRLMIEREAVILNHLHGICCPELVEYGSHEDRPFLASRWLSGVPIRTRAHELRSGTSVGWRGELHELCGRVIDVYRLLHDRGVIHGDVHPGNLIVDADDSVRVLDFGLSRLLDHRGNLDHARRAGLGWYLEPEAARSLLNGVAPPRASMAGEQYAVAALVYALICGEHHLDAPPEREALYRAALEAPALPFVRRGFESWPEIESVLARATAKRPDQRFASVAEFLEAFGRARPPAVLDVERSDRRLPMMESLVDEILDRTARPPQAYDELFPMAPTASVQYGAAGLAWFLYRVAVMRDSPSLLAAADHWSRVAMARLDDENAFEAPDVGIIAERVGPASFYHRSCGVYCVHALISHARGDLSSAAKAVLGFIEASGTEDENVELAFGKSGVLLGGSLLLDVGRSWPRLDPQPLSDHLQRTAGAVWNQLAAAGHAGLFDRLPHLGIAHGWAGVLYAQLRLCLSAGAALPSRLPDRLDQLAALAEPAGRGVSWVGTVQHSNQATRTPAHAPGWCSGSAGYVYLWTLAHELFREARYLDLAEKAAWYAWEHPDRHPRLCCGLAGRVFALLKFYRHSGASIWLDRAWRLAAHLADAVESENVQGSRMMSLYWGTLGPALAALELERPERSAMPLFDAEGWQAPVTAS